MDLEAIKIREKGQGIMGEEDKEIKAGLCWDERNHLFCLYLV